MKKYLFYILFFIFLFIGIEILSSIGLFMLKKISHIKYRPIPFPISEKHKEVIRNFLSGKETFLSHNPTLGWTVSPNCESRSSLYRSNAQGIRADRNYPLEIPPPGRFRLAAFGDSFTFCADVANHETWEAQLESMDHRLEVLNFGVNGYALDQALLRYQEQGARFHPHIVFIGHMSENILRILSTFRPFYSHETGVPLSKPRFILKNDQLVLVDNPLPTRQDLERLLNDDMVVFKKLKAHDYYATRGCLRSWFDPLATVRLIRIAARHFLAGDKDILKNGIYNPSGEAYKLLTKLIDEFYLRVESDSSLPIVLLFPNQVDFDMYMKSRKTSYYNLVEYLEKKGYRHIDLLDVFKGMVDSEEKTEKLIPKHYSPEANKLIAQFLYSYLKANHLFEEENYNKQNVLRIQNLKSFAVPSKIGKD